MSQRLARSVLGRIIYCLIISLAFVAMQPGSKTASAQSETPMDWRGNLTCPPEHQVREGVLYCTGTDSKGHTVHVLVVDLTVSNLRFEYVIPKGASDGHSFRCRPRWRHCPWRAA